MGVITRERKRIAPPPPEYQPLPPAPPPPRRPFPWGLVSIALVVATIALAPGWVRDLLPSLPNPFAAETVDRSQPALLKSIQDLSEYRAATGHFEVIVDLERDTALPDEILGERTLFVGVGTVDATVDFRTLGGDAVTVSSDRRRATITLPQPRLSRPRLDLTQSYVYDRDRGLLNRVGSVFSDGGGNQRAVYFAAEEKIGRAARSGSGLRDRARANTRMILVSLIRALGFETVSVRFV